MSDEEVFVTVFCLPELVYLWSFEGQKESFRIERSFHQRNFEVSIRLQASQRALDWIS